LSTLTSIFDSDNSGPLQTRILEALRKLWTYSYETEHVELRRQIGALAERGYVQAPSARWVALLRDWVGQAVCFSDIELMLDILANHCDLEPQQTVWALGYLLRTHPCAEAQAVVFGRLRDVFLSMQHSYDWEIRVGALTHIAQQARTLGNAEDLTQPLVDLQQRMHAWMLEIIQSLSTRALYGEAIEPEPISRILTTIAHECPFCAFEATAMLVRLTERAKPVPAQRAAIRVLLRRSDEGIYTNNEQGALGEHIARHLSEGHAIANTTHNRQYPRDLL
ncbi:MAG TPA: hypothetical protein PLV25_00100, partial [Opitutales bacterium]|nr:hypothetical protein [Opitutales bacterium]